MKNFRRLIALVAIAVLAIAGTTGASAQFRFGIKAGVNINKIKLDALTSNLDSDNRSGFTGGVMTEFQIPIVNLCFDASLMYTRMNSDIFTHLESPTNESVVPQTSKNNDFLQIPINIKYKLELPMVGNFVAPYVFTGPDFAFRLNGDENYIKTRTVQVAWNVGAGLQLIQHLQIGASYSFGINNMIDKIDVFDGVISTGQVKAKNNYWTITAAWLF